MKTALLLINFQNDYFPTGRMPLEKSLEALQKAQEILQYFRSAKLPVIHLQHFSTRPHDTWFLPCTRGIEIHSGLRPQKNEPVIKKHYPNGFRDTLLESQLKKLGVRHLVVAGMMTHLAVDATVRAAYDRGFTTTILHDACAARDLEFHGTQIPAHAVHNAFLAALQPLYASVTGTRELLQRVTRQVEAPA